MRVLLHAIVPDLATLGQFCLVIGQDLVLVCRFGDGLELSFALCSASLRLDKIAGSGSGPRAVIAAWIEDILLFGAAGAEPSSQLVHGPSKVLWLTNCVSLLWPTDEGGRGPRMMVRPLHSRAIVSPWLVLCVSRWVGRWD